MLSNRVADSTTRAKGLYDVLPLRRRREAFEREQPACPSAR